MVVSLLAQTRAWILFLSLDDESYCYHTRGDYDENRGIPNREKRSSRMAGRP